VPSEERRLEDLVGVEIVCHVGALCFVKPLRKSRGRQEYRKFGHLGVRRRPGLPGQDRKPTRGTEARGGEQQSGAAAVDEEHAARPVIMQIDAIERNEAGPKPQLGDAKEDREMRMVGSMRRSEGPTRRHGVDDRR
jgi:hypothetical protein